MARVQPNRLAVAARHGWDKLSWWRETYTFVCEQMAGPWYEPKLGVSGYRDRRADERRAVNVLQNMALVYLSDLVGHEFDVQGVSKVAGMGGAADLRAMHLSAILRDIKYAQTDMRVVLDALLGGLGVWRIGNRSGTDLVTVDGETYDPGRRYVRRVAPGNLTRDPLSRDPEEDKFVGDRFECDRELLMETFPERADYIATLPTIAQQRQQADPNGPSRRGGTSSEMEISDDHIELWHMAYWDGRRRLECIIPTLESSDFILEPVEYEGPEEGPYEFLGFLHRPDRTMPVAPAQWLLDLHLAVGATSSRMVDDILSTKRIQATRKGMDDDAIAIEEAEHGDTLALDAPESVKELTYGGMVREMQEGFEQLMRMANEQGLDLTQAAGRRSQGGTATEASIVSTNAQRLKQFLSGSLTTARTNILQRLSWYEDVTIPVPTVYKQDIGPGLTVDLLYDEETREGKWQDYTFTLRVKTPASMDENMLMVRTGELMERALPFIMGVAQAGGNVEAAIDYLARVYGAPELHDIFPTQGGMMLAQAAMMQAGGPGQPIGQRPVSQGTASGNPMQDQNAQRQSDSAGAVPAGAPAQ